MNLIKIRETFSPRVFLSSTTPFHVRRVTGSDLGNETVYPERGLHKISQSLQASEIRPYRFLPDAF